MPTRKPRTPAPKVGNPKRAPTGTFDVVGVSGLTRFGTGGASGRIFEEFLPELQGPRGRRVLREMRDNDPIIGAIFFAIEMLVRQVHWHVKPGTESAADQAIADFVQSCFDDMEVTFHDTIGEILSFLTFGFSYQEIIYKTRGGQSDDPRRNSRFNDGKVGWRAWAARGQETLDRWEYDEDDRLVGMWQLGPPDYHFHLIPLTKALLFRTSTYKGNPEGRALDPTTPIPTPHGWKALDALQVGDAVFDEQGKIRYITGRQDWEDRPCYAVTLIDGETIIADAHHEWLTQNQYQRKHRLSPSVRTTEQLALTVRTPRGISNHSISWAAPLDYPDQHLLVDPYYLGLWLGDGTSRSSLISCHEDDAGETAALITACGYTTTVCHNGPEGSRGAAIRVAGAAKWDASGPQTCLRLIGVLGNKHIPISYLRGNEQQRRSLLAGLMDSDGTVDRWGRCEFVNTRRALVDGVAELVRSLGVGVTVRTRKWAGSPGHVLTAWAVKFTPPWSPFRLARKTDRIITEHARRQHYITTIEPVAPRRTVCIEVDSPSHLFLAGRSLVPTHNSVIRNAYTSWYAVKNIKAIEAIGIERDVAGLPIVRVPPTVMAGALPGANAADAAAYNAYTDLATGIRNDEQAGIVISSARDPNNGQYVYDVELLSTGGTRQFNTESVIQRYCAHIAMTVLADFILLGHGTTGTYALGQSKLGAFALALSTWLDMICSVINDVAIPRLLRLNGMLNDNPPTLEHGEVEQADLTALGGYITALSSAGILPKDAGIIRHLLEAAEIPVPDDDLLRQFVSAAMQPQTQQPSSAMTGTQDQQAAAAQRGTARTAARAAGTANARQRKADPPTADIQDTKG